MRTLILVSILPLLLLTSPPAEAQRIFERETDDPLTRYGGDNTAPAFADYDGDGDVDLFIPEWGAGDGALFRNRGDGHFERVRDVGLSGDQVAASVAVWGDYDNDGDPDLFIARQQGHDNLLYRNEGDGTFVTVSDVAPVNDGGNSFAAAWGDYDRDGRLDLVVANGGFATPEPLFLYRNTGGGTFERVSAGPPVDEPLRATGVFWMDLDDDGDPDLVVTTTGGEPNVAFTNDGGDRFSRVTTGALTLSASSAGVARGDFDGDGDFDLFVGNGGGAERPSFLLRNEGDGRYARLLRGPGASMLGRLGSYGGDWGDVDNDGDLDLLAVAYGDGHALFLNDGGHLGHVTSLPGLLGGYASGVAWADLEEDGGLDLVLVNWEGQRVQIYRNVSDRGRWLGVRLVGTASNRDGFGSRVRLRTGSGEAARWQIREHRSQTSWRAQPSPVIHFGLGEASVVPEILVRWPSGREERYDVTGVDRVVTLVEGEGEPVGQ